MSRFRPFLLLTTLSTLSLACSDDSAQTDGDDPSGSATTGPGATSGSAGTTGSGAAGGGSDGGGGGGPHPSNGAVVLYTDLSSAPLGAFVTLFGRRLENAVVTGASIVSQGPTQIVVTWEGNTVQVDGVDVPVTTRDGAVFEATPATLGEIVADIEAGDVVYLREGTYNDKYGTTTWGPENLTLGSWAEGTSFIGYPGENARLDTVRVDDGAGLAHGVTFANLRMEAWSCVHGGSYWENEESGAREVRVVNVDCHGNYGAANTMSGLVGLGADGWSVLGNRFSNDAPEPINNNHAIYIMVGADDVEVAWNHFSDMKVGHVIQQHTDGPARTYEDISIHDNEIIGNDPMDTRGIVISACDARSSARIYNNVILNAGQDFSGIAVYCGNVEVFHNTLANIQGATLLMQWGDAFNVTARNNVFIGGEVGTFAGTLEESDNVTSGTVDEAGHLARAQLASNVGIDIDHAGRPRGVTTAVGAYETENDGD